MPKQDNYISDKIRALVATRANFRCEYCRLHEDDTYLGFEIDHIISKKHGGQNVDSNFAFTCLNCNRNKGSDIASLTKHSNELTPLFNPRNEVWHEHFFLENGFILPKTAVGEVTVSILKLNHEDFVSERIVLQEIHRYPEN